MRKYIPLVLFIFSWPALSADIHGRVVRVLVRIFMKGDHSITSIEIG